VRLFPTKTPSSLVAALAGRVAEGGLTSDVYWGNDGFCVDLAVHHPVRADNITIGVLCDGTRFDKADDPVEWDLFRTSVLEAQGWKPRRVWSPHLARDHAGVVLAIASDAAREVEREASAPHPASGPVQEAPAPLPEARVLN
jgi:hypothetical protein